jgi:hypothetical protein
MVLRRSKLVSSGEMEETLRENKYFLDVAVGAQTGT